MPARLLTTLEPAPAGFAPTALAKRELMSGTVVVLVRRFEEVLTALPDAPARLRGLVLTVDGRGTWRRLGPALWHLRLAPTDLEALPGLLGVMVAVIEDAAAVAEMAHARAIELGRLHADLAATRRDYNLSLEHLSVSEERFRALVETSRDWIWAVDERGSYTYCSPRVKDLLGYEAHEMLGRDFFALMPVEEARRVAPLWEAAVRDGRPVVNLQNVNRHRDGRLVTLETSAVPILDARGACRGYRGIDRDITARKQAEEQRLLLERQILHAQKLESLGVLAGGIAHDFNNLLVAILGNAELALMDMPPAAPGREAVVDIRRASLRASDLTNQMLAYSGKGQFVIEPIDLAALVREMGRLLEISISKRARLHYDLAAPLPAVEADAAQIRQIVMNLVTNASEAIESTQKDGVIALRTRLEHLDRDRLRDNLLGADLPGGPYVALEVADTGCGMSEEIKERLFDPFFTTKFQGRGLGMAAVQGIVRGHRGALEIDSRPERGTRIVVWLPASAEPAAAPTELSFSAPAPWQGQGTALVIDDDENVREFARRILARLGFEVRIAEDGARGLEIFREHAADIAFVLLDLTMPGMDGEQTFRELRLLQPHVPVVLASGYNEQDATSRFAGAGLAGFIKKPYRIEDLTEVIRTALGH